MIISMYLNNEGKMTLDTSDRLTESFELISALFIFFFFDMMGKSSHQEENCRGAKV